jgi:hypothetical protein
VRTPRRLELGTQAADHAVVEPDGPDVVFSGFVCFVPLSRFFMGFPFCGDPAA